MIKTAAVTMGAAALLAGSFIMVPKWSAVSYQRVDEVLEAGNTDQEATEDKQRNVPDNRVEVRHQPKPEQVKAVYMTACVVGTPSFRSQIVSLVQETEVNSIVIDVKDYSGTLSFRPESEFWLPAWQASGCGTSEMRQFINELHDLGIYTIARLTVFQDPFYTKLHPELAVRKADRESIWYDNKGLSFIDVGARTYWDQVVELSRDVYNVGFDEINFDYVRYPSDGPMDDIAFVLSQDYPGDDNMQANLEEFFKYLNNKLDNEELFADYNHTNTGRASSTPWTSVDLFGMVTTNYDDLSIGQVIERAVPYFDFVAPMVYPSHYPKSFLGLGNPNDYPYKVVNYAMASGVSRLAAETTPMQGFTHTRIGTTTPAVYKKAVYPASKLRTWIQDFDYGGDYDAADVRAEIQASYDAGVMSWMIWAPSNIYTQAALNPSSDTTSSAGGEVGF